MADATRFLPMGLETSTPGCGPGLAAGALILGWGCTTAILPPDWLHPRVPPPFRQSQAKPSSNQGLQGLLWGGQGHRSATPGPRTPGQTRICDPPLLRAAPRGAMGLIRRSCGLDFGPRPAHQGLILPLRAICRLVAEAPVARCART